MAAERAYYLYTSDNAGTQYRAFIPVWLGSFTANPFGFAADDTTKAKMPRGLKMRYVTAKDATSGRHRKVHCGNTTAAGWTTLGNSYSLPNIDATSTSYVTEGRVGEKQRA